MAQTFRKNVGLDQRNVREYILKYLYSSEIDRKIKHEPILNQRDMDAIRDSEYLACPRFRGTRSWIVFCRDRDDYYAVNFPKQNLHKREALRIHPIDIPVHVEFYKGTIMEGIYFKYRDCRYLVVDEVYIYAGENMLLKPKDDRLIFIREKISRCTNITPNFIISDCQYYTTDPVSLRELYDRIRCDSNIQEVIFYPRIYGKRIYSYMITDADMVDHIVNMIQCVMHKTGNPDVYQLVDKNDNQKMGIAYIPDISTSKMCRQWFRDNPRSKKLDVMCKLDTIHNKWVPYELLEQDE